jgi:hypothetical protein
MDSLSWFSESLVLISVPDGQVRGLGFRTRFSRAMGLYLAAWFQVLRKWYPVNGTGM